MPAWYYFTRPNHLAVHNFTRTKKPPPAFRTLLGLGLNFCVAQKYSTFNLRPTLTRLRNDLFRRIYHTSPNGLPDSPDYDPKLHLKRNFQPDETHINDKVINRLNQFSSEMKKKFRKKKGRTNLTRCQQECIETLRKSETLCVLKSDKNLGPCIMERDDVIRHALNDHLADGNTYRK
jgi:hypothetical protein